MAIHPAIYQALAWAEVANLADAFLAVRASRIEQEAIRLLFSDYVSPSAFHTVLAGASAVCGPMRPNAGVSRDRFRSARPWLEFLTKCRASGDALEALRRQTQAVRRAALTFVADSVALTGRFLHFLNPHCAPLATPRAAACLDLRPRPNDSQDQAVAMYCDYWTELVDAAAVGAAPSPRFKNLLNAPLAVELDRRRLRASPVRALDSLLCLYGHALDNRGGAPTD
jgi:hypothetical protein